jgi:hypothetical protein
MRDGTLIALTVSFVLHLVLVGVGMWRPPETVRPSTNPMVVLPIELMTISDETNVAAMTTRDRKDAENALEEAQRESVSSPSAAAEVDDTEIVPTATIPAVTSTPTPRPTATPTPRRSETPRRVTDADVNRELERMLTGIGNNPPAPRNNTPTRIDNVGETNRPGIGNNRENTATYAAYFGSQLKERCWGDHDDWTDAHRLRAVFRVKFTRAGRLAIEPDPIEPSRIPANDRPMQRYMVDAVRALRQCEPFRIPPEYVRDGMPPVDLEFLP